MLQPLLKMGHPVLAQVAAKVLPAEFSSTALRQLVQDLEDTRLHHGGVGIAAPQIGVAKQVAIIHYSNNNPRYAEIGNCPLTVVINPVVSAVGDEMLPLMEGCLSIPSMRGEALRAKKVAYRYFDIDGNEVSGTDDGFFARVLQHECDHLNGILYPVRIQDFSKFGFIE